VIVVCGKRFPTAAPVVPWFAAGGHDAYRTEAGADGAPAGPRYRPVRRAPAFADGRGDESALERLRRTVDLLVLHYDVCGTSRRCFRVLQEERGLSVHFLLDVDGTIYQTLDLQEEAWHARQANPRSIGVEIAQIGAYPPDAAEPLARWYDTTGAAPRLCLPEDSGVLHAAGASLRPARAELLSGSIQGEPLVQYDFTPEQYASLAELAASLTRIFPRLSLEVPRDASGAVRTDALSDAELAAFHGVLGHCHVSADKIDPGPAFDWESWLAEARRRASPSPRARRTEPAPPLLVAGRPPSSPPRRARFARAERSERGSRRGAFRPEGLSARGRGGADPGARSSRRARRAESPVGRRRSAMQSFTQMLQEVLPHEVVAVLTSSTAVLIALVSLVVVALASCRIAAKAGYHASLGLLVLVPVANVMLFLTLAFSRWPVEQELRSLRHVEKAVRRADQRHLQRVA